MLAKEDVRIAGIRDIRITGIRDSSGGLTGHVDCCVVFEQFETVSTAE